LYTELRQKTVELERENDARLQDTDRLRRQAVALESAANGILITDRQGDIIWCNPAFTRMTGYGAEEVIGKNPRIFKSGHHDPSFFVELWTTVLAGKVWHGEVMNRRKNGTLYFEEQTITPVLDERGEVIQFVAINQDVTDRKHAEEKLRASEAHIRLLLDSTAEAIYGIDREGRCTFCNPACLKVLGYRKAEDLLGKEMHDLVHHSRPDGKPLPIEECRIHQALHEGEEIHVDDEVYWQANRTSIPVEYWSYPIRRDGQVVGAVVTFLDITQRRQLEQQFQQAQKMEAVGRLAGGVAHDFNNLLTVILGYSELLLGRLPAQDASRDLIQEIRRAGERAANLTRQLLAFSRKQIMVPEVLDLNQVVEETKRMLRRLIAEDITLTTKLDPQLDFVKVDPGQIDQVIMNLVINASDAMPKGGSLTLETRNVELDESYTRNYPDVRPGNYVLIAISDTGCGMNEETKAHIFEPFFTTKAPGKGTGLGLATVFGIVKQCSGHVTVHSELNKGTTVKIYLPTLPQEAKKLAARKTQFTIPKGTETVLVAEDEEGLRVVIRIVLQTNGYQVLEAINGEEALALAKSHPEPIHLLLADLVMPKKGGRELADEIAIVRPETKVIYMSGYTDDAVVRLGVLEADMPFLQKPFTPATLARKVREVLDSPS